MIVWERFQSACERLWAAEDRYNQQSAEDYWGSDVAIDKELRDAQEHVLAVARSLRPGAPDMRDADGWRRGTEG